MTPDPVVEERRPAVKRSNRPLLVAIAALILLGILGIVLARVFRERPITSATPAPSLSTPNIIDSNKSKAPKTVNITDAPKPAATPPAPAVQAPADVVTYLKHLKQVELYRQQMKGNVEKQLMSEISNSKDLNPILKLLDDPEHANLDDQAKEAQAINSGAVKIWMNFQRWFRSVPPPDECKPLYNAYYAGTQAVVTSISSVQDALSNLDLSKLKEMQGQSSDVDKQYSNANDELNKLRSKYNLPDDFEIKSEKSTNLLFGF